MPPFRVALKEMTFLSWGGLRGALPLVLATFPATAGVAAGDTIFNLVFFVVLVSALLQGTTVAPLAKRLDLVVDRPAWQSIADAVELEDVDIDLIEIEVTHDLALVGTRLGTNPPPDGMLITTMIRDHKASIPNSDTVFASGDFLIVAVNSGRDRVREVTAWARGEITGTADVEAG